MTLCHGHGSTPVERLAHRLRVRIAKAMRVSVIAGSCAGGFERLEPYDGKLSRTVLRGACGRVTVLWAGNGPRLPGFSVPSALSATAAGYLGRPTNAADAEDRAADLKRSTARLSFPH